MEELSWAERTPARVSCSQWWSRMLSVQCRGSHCEWTKFLPFLSRVSVGHVEPHSTSSSSSPPRLPWGSTKSTPHSNMKLYVENIHRCLDYMDPTTNSPYKVVNLRITTTTINWSKKKNASMLFTDVKAALYLLQCHVFCPCNWCTSAWLYVGFGCAKLLLIWSQTHSSSWSWGQTIKVSWQFLTCHQRAVRESSTAYECSLGSISRCPKDQNNYLFEDISQLAEDLIRKALECWNAGK